MCGTKSNFTRRRREIAAPSPRSEIYVTCHACPYELVLIAGHPDVIDVALDVERLAGRVRAGQTLLKWTLNARRERLSILVDEHGPLVMNMPSTG
jgi:hypothetical protein